MNECQRLIIKRQSKVAKTIDDLYNSLVQRLRDRENDNEDLTAMIEWKDAKMALLTAERNDEDEEWQAPPRRRRKW